MKLCTILGTRPEIIRLSRILPKLDRNSDHHVIWTGQNYDRSLNEIFWEELNLRKPDTTLDCKKVKNFGEQTGKILAGVEEKLCEIQPDKVLILGDTNSGLSAIIAARMGIPVFHMEAGNRCFDPRVPEEINRRIIDHTSTYNLPYTERSRDHLLQEGFPLNRILVSGNPIGEVLTAYESQIEGRKPWQKLVGNDPYMLATFHRSENVDNKETLKGIIDGLEQLSSVRAIPIVCSIHPRTRSKLRDFGIVPSGMLLFSEPFGFFDFVALQKHAKLVLTDSGTVQEECTILHTPCVVMRRSTERIEAVECGASVIAGTESRSILSAAGGALNKPKNWQVPKGYNDADVSDRVVAYLQGTFYVE